MKKHKVKIPNGYEVESISTNDPPTRIMISLKPIKKELPKTWEEFRKNTQELTGNEWFHRLMPEKYVEAFDALGKLIELRDHYNDGWEPDWTSDDNKYCIIFDKNDIYSCIYEHVSYVLAFKDDSLVKEFMTNFRELIEAAKPVLCYSKIKT